MDQAQRHNRVQRVQVSSHTGSAFLLGFDIDGGLVGSLAVGHLASGGRCSGVGGGAAILHAVLEALDGASEVGAHVLELLGAEHHNHDQQNDQPSARVNTISRRTAPREISHPWGAATRVTAERGGTMSKRSRIFFGLLLIYAIGMAAVLYRVVSDLDPRYRESAEESLVETSQLLATLIEQDVRDGAIDTARLDSLFKAAYAREFSAQIFTVTKTKVELRAYVTDRSGTVVYDSTGQSQGKDFSQWRDVQLTLKGEYGARTTLDIPGDPNSAVMYMAAPVRWTSNAQGAGSGEIIGAVTVGKPVQTFGQFVAAARSRTLYAGLISVLAVLVLAVMVSMWLVRPFGLIADYARYIKAQQGFHPGRLLRRAWDLMRAAYDEMRDALAGRNYVADYVQTLTHEVKSPLSAIRGAAELLQEPSMPHEERERFLANI
eukprot:gene16785-34877_t